MLATPAHIISANYDELKLIPEAKWWIELYDRALELGMSPAKPGERYVSGEIYQKLDNGDTWEVLRYGSTIDLMRLTDKKTFHLSESFILRFLAVLPKIRLMEKQKLSEAIIERMMKFYYEAKPKKPKTDEYLAAMYKTQVIPLKLLKSYASTISPEHWKIISEFQPINEETYDALKQYLDKSLIGENYKVSSDLKKKWNIDYYDFHENITSIYEFSFESYFEKVNWIHAFTVKSYSNDEMIRYSYYYDYDTREFVLEMITERLSSDEAMLEKDFKALEKFKDEFPEKSKLDFVLDHYHGLLFQDESLLFNRLSDPRYTLCVEELLHYK
jgi:hypothetical protein